MMDLGDILCTIDLRCNIDLHLISKEEKRVIHLDLYNSTDLDWDGGCRISYKDGKYIFIPISVINMPVFYFYPEVEYNVVRVYAGSHVNEYDMNGIKCGKIKKTKKRIE